MTKYKIIVSAMLCLLLLASCGKKDGGIAKKLYTPPPPPPTAKVTFPEGFTVMQYARLLEENGVCTAEEFYRAVNEVDYREDFTFLPEQSVLDTRPYKLEGYLFPDTYEFFLDESGESVVKRFLKNFRSRVDEPLAEEIGANGYTIDQSITIAAIVERETPVVEEMPKIAAVFINRLKSPDFPKLQSDATKFYPYEGSAAIPAEVKEGFVSEYNTYNVKGLPKGAICNPSLSAIKGVLNYEKNFDYYFFYTDKNNKHYYAKTLKEHNANYKYCKDNDLLPF
ncbi:MAG: endolytic transglycosylase MltG [Oscillospiraceae bacterium]|jgi:UPF0755 protein|nr:endolytic transglycosylase MltG [Oscillospiraceae bacterium]